MTATPHTPSDPLTALQRSTRAWAVAASVAVVAVGVWAWWPQSRSPLNLELADAPSSPTTPAAPKLAFNADAFSAPVWVPTPPPPPSAVVAQKPPPPPLKLQLIGITRDTPSGGGEPVLRAALYDPDADKLVIVAAGEKIPVTGTPGYTVARLTSDAIDLSDGETTRTLSLRDERRTGS